MDIHLPKQRNQRIQFDADASEQVRIIRGKAGFAVKVGEKLMGFSGEPPKSVSLEVEQGTLRIRLQSESGAVLAEYGVPSAKHLQQQVSQLADQGVVFEANEAKALQDLMKLSLNGGVSKTEILLLLDEISHAAPEIQGSQSVNTSQLYPELNQRIGQLLRVMPEDIQQFVVQTNRDNFPEPVWRAFHLISKLNPETDQSLLRFLGGRAPLNDAVMMQLQQVANRTTLFPQAIDAPLDMGRLELLAQKMQELNLKPVGNPGLIRLPQQLLDKIFQNFQLQIPDFAAAESLDAMLQAHQMKQVMAHESTQVRHPLENLLLNKLDTRTFSDLAAFLKGKPGATFGESARAELQYFLKNMPQNNTEFPLSSIQPNAMARVLKWLRNIQPEWDLPSQQSQQASKPNGMTEAMVRRMAALSPEQRQALWVLDRLDPERDSDLFRYFDGRQKLKHITIHLKRKLDAFLQAGDQQPVPRGLTDVKGQRFDELARFLKDHPRFHDPGLTPPKSDLLSQAVMRLPILVDGAMDALQIAEDTPSKLSDPSNKPTLREGLQRAAILEAKLQGFPKSDHAAHVSEFLKEHIDHLPELRFQDRLWKAAAQTEQFMAGTGGSRSHHHLRAALDGLLQAAKGKDDGSTWFLWDAEQHAPDLKLPGSARGLARYLMLDQVMELSGKAALSHFADSGASQKLNDLVRDIAIQRQAVAPEKLQELRRLLTELRDLTPSFDQEAPLPDAQKLANLPALARNQLVSEQLQRRLADFKRVAVLDQAWHAQQLSQMMSGERGEEAARQLPVALRRLADLVGGREVSPDWQLWRAPRPDREIGRPPDDPRAPWQERILRDHEGLARYEALEKLLPQKESGLQHRLSELGWLRQLDRLAEQVEQYRGESMGRLQQVAEKSFEFLNRLTQFLTESEDAVWHLQPKSQLSDAKAREFQAFRAAILAGEKPDPASLFEGPFLKESFGEAAEQHQAREMRRLEPMFREVLNRLAADGDSKPIDALLRQVFDEGLPREAVTKLQTFSEQVREFNQHQNLNQMPLYVSLPLRYQGQEGNMEFAYMRLPGGERKQGRFLVVIHLDFEVWGHLRVDALRQDGQLSATFWVENMQMHRQVNKSLHALEDRLEALGMGEVMLNTKLEPSRATKSVADLVMPRDDGQLDVSV